MTGQPDQQGGPTGIEAAKIVSEYLALRLTSLDEGDAANIIHILHQAGVRFRVPTRDGAEGAQPFAWTVPGDDQADYNGFIPTKIVREGEFTKPLYASPPVRGDREAWQNIDKIIDALEAAGCCRNGQVSSSEDHVANTIRDWLRSLPVQPAIDKTKFYAALSSRLASDMIDIVWQAVQESVVLGAVQPGAGEREPTPDMRIAGGIAWAEALKTAETYVDCADACWKAMWDAHPSPERGAADIEGFVSGPYKYEKDLHACFRVIHPDERRLVACVYATAGEEQAEADAELFDRALRQAPHSSSETES